MDFLLSFIDLVLHLDKHLPVLIAEYGTWIYLALFLVIFCRDRLGHHPFFAGRLPAFRHWCHCRYRCHGCAVAACPAGFGLISGRQHQLLDRSPGWAKDIQKPDLAPAEPGHLDKTHQFYEKHGGKAIFLARFFPIIRTFAPFVAGMGSMHYPRFILFSLSGSLTWVGAFVLGGYFFGNIPVIQENLTLVMLAIILLSIAPGIIGFFKSRGSKS